MSRKTRRHKGGRTGTSPAGAGNPLTTLFRQGLTLQEQGKLAEAAGIYRRVLDSDPKHVDARNHLGNVLRLLDRMDEAQACYRKAMELNPDHPDAVMNFAIEQPFAPDDPNFARPKAHIGQLQAALAGLIV